VTEPPPEDPRDALIHEQAGQIAALTALVAELREQLGRGPAGHVQEFRQFLDAAEQR